MNDQPIATETTNPAVPEFKMSPAGAALRAELEKATAELAAKRAQQTHPGAKDFGAQPRPEPQPPTDKPIVKDAAGNVVDLTTGEVTRTTPEDTGNALVPEVDLLPGEYREPAQQLAVDLEALGQDKGYPRERLQAALDAGIDLFMAGERNLGVDTQEKCLNVLTTKYGAADAAKLIEQAQAQAKSMGPATLKWLDDSGVGNSPAAIAVLAAAFRGDLQMNANAAASLIKKLRTGPNPNDKAVIDRVRILTRIANPKSSPKPEQIYYGVLPSGNPLSTIGSHQTAAELRRELDALNRLDSDLHGGDGPKRTKAVKRRQQIVQQLGGSR